MAISDAKIQKTKNIITMSHLNKLFFVCFLAFVLGFLRPEPLLAQNNAVVFGKVSDDRGRPLELVNISIMGVPGGTSSDGAGLYELAIPANKNIIVAFSILSYSVEFDTVNLAPGQRFELNVVLSDKATYSIRLMLPLITTWLAVLSASIRGLRFCCPLMAVLKRW